MCLRSVSSRNLSPVSWSEVNCNQPSLHFLPFWKALVFLNVIEPVPGKSLTQTLFQKLPQVKRQGFPDHLILQIKYGSRRKHGVIQRTVLSSKQKVLLSSSEAWLGLRNPKIWYCTQLSMRPRQLAKAKKFKGKKKSGVVMFAELNCVRYPGFMGNREPTGQWWSRQQSEVWSVNGVIYSSMAETGSEVTGSNRITVELNPNNSKNKLLRSSEVAVVTANRSPNLGD